MFDAAAFDYGKWLKAISRFRFGEAAAMRSDYNRTHLLSAGIATRLRRAQRFKPVAIVVHTRRDMWHMKYVHGLRNVFDHPLSFLSGIEAEKIRGNASRRRFPILDAVPSDARLVGVFGFIGRYKGLETVIRALHHLPHDHHLLIFGGVHPNEIRPHQPIDPVVSSLFEAGYVDTNVAERIRAIPSAGTPTVTVALDGSMRDLLIQHPKDLSGIM
jgi:glycosyltransferase involved in cell wall biosynthesis